MSHTLVAISEYVRERATMYYYKNLIITEINEGLLKQFANSVLFLVGKVYRLGHLFNSEILRKSVW